MQKNRLLPKIRALAGLTVLAMLGMSASAAEGLYMTGDAGITVNGGASLVVGSLTNTSIGLIKNNGTVEISGNLQNDGSALFDAASTGSVVFNGTAAQAITGTASVHVYGPVELDNAAGVALTDAATGADATIHGNVACLPMVPPTWFSPWATVPTTPLPFKTVPLPPQIHMA